MIKTLDRYLLRSFLANYFLALFVLISLYVVLDLSFNSDEFTETITEGTEQNSSYAGAVAKVILNAADYYFFNIPLYFSQLSGVITLFLAACVTLARLQRQNEVVAVLSSGTSLYRLAMPIILAGLVMNALLLFDQEVLLPSIAPKLARSRDNVEGARTYDLWFVKDNDGRLLSAQKFSPKEQQIAGLTILERFNEPADAVNYGQLRSVIRADRARWDEQKGGWELMPRCFRLEIGRQSGIHTSGVNEKLEPLPVTFYKTDLSPGNLLLRKSAQWLDFLSLRDVSLLEKRGDVEPPRAARIRHTRFTLPISNMVLLLLGIPFFMNRLPGNVLSQGSKALAVCAVAFLMTFLGQHVVEPTGGFWQALPYWLPIFIFGPASVLLLDNVKT